MKSLAQLKAESKTETLLKRREKADEDRVYSEIAKEREELEARKRARTPSVKTLSSFVASGKDKEKGLKSLQIRMKKTRTDIPDEGILLVVRIHLSVNAANPVKKALHELRLNNRYTAVLVNITPDIKKLIVMVEPFIIFGRPTAALIEKLVRKRGKVMRNAVEVELKDNNYVEEVLESWGVLCIDDIIYELRHGAENFERVSMFLCPFKLNLPKRKFKKTAHAKGGDYGFREDINLIVEEMI